jgi:hypothetical protein
MTLYARITLGLMGAASGGATALAVAATADVAPNLMWAALLGGMLGLAVGLARWVLRPLRRFAAELGDGHPPPVDGVLAHLKKSCAALQARLAEREQDVEAQVSDRIRDLVTANAALTVLFDAVSDDRPELSDDDYVARFLSHWIGHGTVRAAGVWWSDATPRAFLSGGDAPVHPHQVPAGLLADLRAGGPPAARVEGGLAWLAVAVPARDTGAGRAPRAPRAMVAAWPAERPPTEAERLACVAVARYLGTRSAARGLAPETPGPVAAPAPEPAPEPTPEPSGAPVPDPQTARQ